MCFRLLTGSKYRVAHTFELRRSFIKNLKEHMLYGNYGVGSKMGDVDINTLTMEQYLALTREGMVKPEIRNSMNFEIKIQLMKDLREDTFSGNKNDDDHEHVEMVLDILLRDRFIGYLRERSTLGIYLRKLSSKGIVQRPRLPNSLKRSITSSKRAMKHCTKLGKGLDTPTRQLLDSHRPISGITPAQALELIQTTEDDSQKWHDRSSNKRTSSGSSNDIAAITSKLDSLGNAHLTKKTRELRSSSMVSMEDIFLTMVETELDLGASVNIMPHSMFKSLKLTNIKETTALVEMADMSKKAHVGIVENVIVKIDRFLFPYDFVAIDMQGDPNETMILGTTNRAQRNDRNDGTMNGNLEIAFFSKFKNEISYLANAYELRIRKQWYIPDDIWEKCEQVYGRTLESWYEEELEEEEQRKCYMDGTYYDPPELSVDTFKVKCYSLDNGKSFMCVKKMLKDEMPIVSDSMRTMVGIDVYNANSRMLESGDLDKIEQSHTNKKLGHLMANLQKHCDIGSSQRFVRDFNSHAKEADESFAKNKALEFEIKRLLRAVVSQDIMSNYAKVIQVVICIEICQTELERTKDRC
ncbi:RNA-directed DNA polymerase, eukaryota, reverse transcriptase zinc-binding domain protein [Tanacetum coccineum]